MYLEKLQKIATTTVNDKYKGKWFMWWNSKLYCQQSQIYYQSQYPKINGWLPKCFHLTTFSNIYVVLIFYPCSYICKCLKMTKKYTILTIVLSPSISSPQWNEHNPKDIEVCWNLQMVFWLVTLHYFCFVWSLKKWGAMWNHTLHHMVFHSQMIGGQFMSCLLCSPMVTTQILLNVSKIFICCFVIWSVYIGCIILK